MKPVTRRRFFGRLLWVGAGSTAIVAGGFAWLRRSPHDSIALPAGIIYMKAAHYQLFEKLITVMLPVAGTSLFPPSQLPISAKVDSLLAGIRPEVREQLLMGLSLFDNLAVLGGGHMGRFVDLPDEDARAYLTRWMNSSLFPLRAIASAAARLVKSAYWSFPVTWTAIGFGGPVSRRQGIPMLGNAPLPGRAS